MDWHTVIVVVTDMAQTLTSFKEKTSSTCGDKEATNFLKFFRSDDSDSGFAYF